MEEIRFKYPLYSLLQTFQKNNLEFTIPRPNRTFNVPNPLVLIYYTRLPVSLSHLRESKFCRKTVVVIFVDHTYRI